VGFAIRNVGDPPSVDPEPRGNVVLPVTAG
jgi:hypothetical protein